MKKMQIICCVCLPLLAAIGCQTTPDRPGQRAVLRAEVDEAIAVFKERDPGIDRFFTESAGYAVLPKVYKGAFWIGGAWGNGIVFENSSMTGYCSMTQATLGFSFGGEFFREIIFFNTERDMGRFKSSEFTLSAQATAVALNAGAAAKTDYKDGMAVFVIADTGLMVDASVGGQKFNYESAPQIVD